MTELNASEGWFHRRAAGELGADRGSALRSVRTSGWRTRGTKTSWRILATTARLPARFTARTQPSAIVLDGTNIWVANRTPNSVTELRAIDGVFVRTVAVGAGASPAGIVFDGSSLWVADSGPPS